MLPTELLAVLVFALTYAGIALGGVPWLRIDRTGIALLGAALMLVVGALKPDEAYQVIDLNTLALLLGMMIVVAHLKVSGVFRALSATIIAPVHAGWVLVANLIVAEKARADGIEVSFGAYLLVGLPLTVLSLGCGIWWRRWDGDEAPRQLPVRADSSCSEGARARPWRERVRSEPAVWRVFCALFENEEGGMGFLIVFLGAGIGGALRHGGSPPTGPSRGG